LKVHGRRAKKYLQWMMFIKKNKCDGEKVKAQSDTKGCGRRAKKDLQWMMFIEKEQVR